MQLLAIHFTVNFLENEALYIYIEALHIIIYILELILQNQNSLECCNFYTRSA